MRVHHIVPERCHLCGTELHGKSEHPCKGLNITIKEGLPPMTDTDREEGGPDPVDEMVRILGTMGKPCCDDWADPYHCHHEDHLPRLSAALAELHRLVQDAIAKSAAPGVSDELRDLRKFVVMHSGQGALDAFDKARKALDGRD